MCPKAADVVQAGSFGPIRTFAEYASAYLKRRYLPDLLSGRQLMALGMSEPDAGSAVTALTTRASREGNTFVINGSKVFSTHSPDATVFLIYVRFGPGTDGIGSVVVERETKGVVQLERHVARQHLLSAGQRRVSRLRSGARRSGVGARRSREATVVVSRNPIASSGAPSRSRCSTSTWKKIRTSGSASSSKPKPSRVSSIRTS